MAGKDHHTFFMSQSELADMLPYEIRARRRFYLKWAIRAFAIALLKQGHLTVPMSFDIKPEDPRVTELRRKYAGGQTGLASLDDPADTGSGPRFSFNA